MGSLTTGGSFFFILSYSSIVYRKGHKQGVLKRVIKMCWVHGLIIVGDGSGGGGGGGFQLFLWLSSADRIFILFSKFLTYDNVYQKKAKKKQKKKNKLFTFDAFKYIICEFSHAFKIC